MVQQVIRQRHTASFYYNGIIGAYAEVACQSCPFTYMLTKKELFGSDYITQRKILDYHHWMHVLDVLRSYERKAK